MCGALILTPPDCLPPDRSGFGEPYGYQVAD